MDLLSNLKEEHFLILKVLTGFETLLAQLGRSEPVQAQDFLRFVVFFSDFADGWHHGQEEEVLLPAMARHGYDTSSGVLSRIHEQHRRERALFRKLKRALAARRPWSDRHVEAVVGIGTELVALERTHIQREADLFYPTAAKELALEPRGDIDADLVQFTENHAFADHVQWLRELGEDLASSHRRS